MTLLRRRGRRPQPWKNGKGVTEEIVAGPVDDDGRVAWRVSIATIDRAAEFSRFEGADRLLMPLAASGLELRVEGRVRRIAQFDVLAFPGEAEVASIGGATATEDLNLIVDRGFGSGSLVRRYVAGAFTLRTRADDAAVVLVALCGTLRCAGTPLESGDAVLLREEESEAITGFGTAAVARVALQHAAKNARNAPSM